ncbi:hypothetical protein PtA15_7A440 [Puccinia triticina]|uniref:DUF3741 domain-containing protein n=1 Tax=Puccinia triticina TaxID=208348 RepID=A0ABY7CVH4_9BASI|nr:uncharacterized protein PtA15_7A440 [Puccinia triticina]WAQ86712.1 hypothetical protein PtA15_7A440 [Puccinia triticina]WAR56578.1 hypothetical protein PtB15_7B427 [Puccinia triticina]
MCAQTLGLNACSARGRNTPESCRKGLHKGALLRMIGAAVAAQKPTGASPSRQKARPSGVSKPALLRSMGLLRLWESRTGKPRAWGQRRGGPLFSREQAAGAGRSRWKVEPS